MRNEHQTISRESAGACTNAENGERQAAKLTRKSLSLSLSLPSLQGNFVDMPPTATELIFQSNGGSDRFGWPIGDEEAQTLSDSYVDFLRDSVNGGVVSWMLFSAVDDDGLQLNIMFDRIADAQGGSVKHRASPLIARNHAHAAAAAATPSKPAAAPSTPLADALHDQLELVQTQAEHRRIHAQTKQAQSLTTDAAPATGAAGAHGLQPALLIAVAGILALAILGAVVFGNWRSSKEIAALRLAIEQQQPAQRA